MTTLSAAQKDILAMSRDEFLDSIRAVRPADKLTVGVCIFRMDTSGQLDAQLAHPHDPPSCSYTAVPRHGPASPSSSSYENCANENTTAGGGGGSGGNGNELWELPGGKGQLERLLHRGGGGAHGARVDGAHGRPHRRGAARDTPQASACAGGAGLDVGGGGRGGGGRGGGGRGGGGGGAAAAAAAPARLTVRRETLQLNYTVLIESIDDLRFGSSRDHDELVWATFGRVEGLQNLLLDLRLVLHQAPCVGGGVVVVG
ncbi:hypothetical protein F4779DRAFT_620661 [Xylariaceae sp. FL0662B]|nr:hypothetical protein F4779DRAFT_620661 [Xylariaceae sp. FL0662B]